MDTPTTHSPASGSGSRKLPTLRPTQSYSPGTQRASSRQRDDRLRRSKAGQLWQEVGNPPCLTVPAGDRWGDAEAPNRAAAGTTTRHRLELGQHGKEGVDGSSPSEGS